VNRPRARPVMAGREDTWIRPVQRGAPESWWRGLISERVVHTDRWIGYGPLKGKGYCHRMTFLKGQEKSGSELLPQFHLVASLPKRWLLGTHQGAVSRAQTFSLVGLTPTVHASLRWTHTYRS
jgi:hypothetical protein